MAERTIKTRVDYDLDVAHVHGSEHVPMTEVDVAIEEQEPVVAWTRRLRCTCGEEVVVDLTVNMEHRED